jgi:hypothetical protein
MSVQRQPVIFNMAFHAEVLTEHTPDPCPIHTCDEAILWLAATSGRLSFVANVATVEACGQTGRWKIGFGGFDPRGAVLMAARECWQKVNA